MKKIAIDIALIPEKKLFEEAVELNAKLTENVFPSYILGKEKIPHITLLQGAIETKDLKAIENKIKDLAKKHPDLPLKPTQIAPPRPNSSLWIYLDKSPILQAVHEDCLQSCLPFFTFENLDGRMFADWQEGKSYQNEVNWLENFIGSAAYQNFSPHITIGKGNPHKQRLATQNSHAASLGIYQMGEGCSCAKELFSVGLG